MRAATRIDLPIHQGHTTVKLLSTLLGLPLLCCAVMPAAAAGDVSLAERDAIVAASTGAALARLKLQPGALRLVPDQLRRSGDWAFLIANVRSASGGRFDYAGTDLHEAAQAGAVSDGCAALLRRDGARWKVIDIAVGPSDVAWENWAATHQAPAALFK